MPENRRKAPLQRAPMVESLLHHSVSAVPSPGDTERQSQSSRLLQTLTMTVTETASWVPAGGLGLGAQ
jgi:hypothetical protein